VQVAHIWISFGLSWYSASCFVIFCCAHKDDIAAPINQAARPGSAVRNNPRRGILISESDTFSLLQVSIKRRRGAMPGHNLTSAHAVAQAAASVTSAELLRDLTARF
jgi:hypothetical protein